ncbi:MAG: hypothetical protein CMK32_11355 [Porticoccaceae bacterium]|nr:hypothetical protein [Porticoccaceae bacterium]
MISRAFIVRGALAVCLIAVMAVVGYGIYYSNRPPAVYQGPPTVKLISQPQYANTVAYIFGDDIEVPPQFPPVAREDGLLSLGYANTAITPVVVERFYRYGQSVAEQVLGPDRRSYFVPCTPASVKTADGECARDFIVPIGRLLYRRTLSSDEVAAYVDLANTAATQLQDFYQGLSYVLSAMMASPEFVFIWDRLEDDPDNPGQVRLDAYSKASRLSFFFWNSTPDDQLLNAAETGQIHTEEGVRRQVERLVGSPRLKQSIRAFFADMLMFDHFENLAKDSVIYPAYGPGVSGDAAEQSLRTITHHLVDNLGDYRDLFTTRETFLTNTLAALYRVPVEPSREFVPHEFAEDSHRDGLLTQVAFLSLHSHPGRSSPTLRGKGLRESLLCQEVPRPPPNVDFSNFEDAAGDFKTARERLVRHSSDPACANCHKITDPIGLGFENFDGAGQFRAREGGALIDASGELDGIPFADASALGEAVKQHPGTTECVVSRLLANAINRPNRAEDVAVIDDLLGDFAQHGYRITDLMRSIALSEAFFAVAEPSPDVATVARAD